MKKDKLCQFKVKFSEKDNLTGEFIYTCFVKQLVITSFKSCGSFMQFQEASVSWNVCTAQGDTAGVCGGGSD